MQYIFSMCSCKKSCMLIFVCMSLLYIQSLVEFLCICLDISGFSQGVRRSVGGLATILGPLWAGGLTDNMYIMMGVMMALLALLTVSEREWGRERKKQKHRESVVFVLSQIDGPRFVMESWLLLLWTVYLFLTMSKLKFLHSHFWQLRQYCLSQIQPNLNEWNIINH